MKIDAKFSFRVWATTTVLSPLIFVSVDSILSHEFTGVLLWFMLIFGLFFSLPALLILYLGTAGLNYFMATNILKRTILSLLSMAYILISFELFLHGLSHRTNDIYMVVPYCIVCVASIWIYRFEGPAQKI